MWPAPRGLSVEFALGAGQIYSSMVFLRMPRAARDALVSAWGEL